MGMNRNMLFFGAGLNLCLAGLTNILGGDKTLVPAHISAFNVLMWIGISVASMEKE